MNQKNKNISLNGIWKYIPDAESRLSYYDIASVIREENTSGEMKVPSNWQLEGLDNFNGSVWFVKEFDSDASGELHILKFNGIDYFSDVWLNDTYLGNHEGYFQSFFFDVTKLIKDKNILVVKVTSPIEEPGVAWPLRKKLIKGIFNHHDCRPGGWDLQHGQDKNTGGIWNDVQLISNSPVYITSVKFTSRTDLKNNKAEIVSEIYYYTNKTSIESEIVFNVNSPEGNSNEHRFNALFQRGEGKLTYMINIDNPALWWSWDTGKANLYKINISSTKKVFDTQEINFGIREVMLDDEKQFFINGKRLFLRGTNIIPTQFLSDLTKEKIVQLVKQIKEANINIVRVHAHVNRKELYEEFDKQGILLWQDFALQWTYDESPEFAANAISQIKDMVRQLNNFSSIVFWCCHNEPGEQINTLDYFLRLAVLNEDSTRIVRTASNYEEHPYDGWYWGNKEHYAAAPMGPLVTEFGAQALPAESSLKKIFSEEELFPPDWDKWQFHNFQPDQTFNIAKVQTGDTLASFVNNSQSYQADVLKTAVEFYRRKKYKGITGIFQFMFTDCWPSITWSIVDYFGVKKPGYDVLKQVYSPLFISINVRQDQYYPGKKALLDLYIINDLHKNFHDCSLVFFLNDKEVYSMNKINVDADDVVFVFYEKINIILPDNIVFGEHVLKVNLIYQNSVIASAGFNFRVVENILALKTVS